MYSSSKHLHNHSASVVDLCKQCLNRIERTKILNAFITVLEDDAILQASLSKKNLEQGISRSVIEGMPIAVKDNFCTKNVKTTCASRMLQNFIPPYDATVVKRLKEAGAFIIGKTNLDEFAMGSGTVDSIFGPTRNIWGSPLDNQGEMEFDEKRWRIAGGSSGGSAIAVATGSCYAAIASDTGGSTRNPASYCGIVGFKPSYGLVSRNGLIPLVNSLDVPGILARKVDDVVNVFDVISGVDEKDSTTLDIVLNVNDKIFNVADYCIGIPKEFNKDGMSSIVADTWKKVADIFDNAGAKVVEVSMEHISASIATYTVLNCCEVASNMARYSGLLFGHRSQSFVSTEENFYESRKEGFGPVVRSRILAGNYFLLKNNYEKYFMKAMKVRRLISQDFQKVWESGVHFLLTPTTLTTAPFLDDFIKLNNRDQCAIQDYCTQPANMSGCPAISLPICLSKERLPVSLQLMAANCKDVELLKVSRWLESVVAFPHLVEFASDETESRV